MDVPLAMENVPVNTLSIIIPHPFYPTPTLLSLRFSLYVVPIFLLQQGPFTNPSKPLSSSYDLETLSVPATGMSHKLSLFYLFVLLDERRGKIYILMVAMWSEGYGLTRFVFSFSHPPHTLLWPSLLKIQTSSIRL